MPNAAMPTTLPRLSPGLTGATVLVMFLWALCFPLIESGLAYAPPMLYAAMRAALSGVVLLVAAGVLRRPPIARGPTWIAIVIVGLTATSMGFFGMFYGGSRVSPGLATVIANTQPLIAAMLAWGILNEAINNWQRLGLALGFTGIVLFSAPSLSTHDMQLSGIGLILMSAVGIAVSNVLLKRLAGKVDILRAMGWQLVIGSAPLAALALSIESVGAIDWSPLFVLNLLALSVLGTSAAFVIWFYLLKRAALTDLNAFTFLTPGFALIMGWLFFAESLDAFTIIGIVISLLGISLVNRATIPIIDAVSSSGHCLVRKK